MKIASAFGFVFRFAVLGLAAAFVVVWLRPDFLPGFNGAEEEETAAVISGDWSGPASYSDAVNRSAPSVVSIYTRTMVNEPLGEYSEPLLQRLFGDRMVARPQAGLGSGVIVSEDGFILTTLHVIEGVDDILISLWDGRLVEADVVGTDPATDLAVLKVEMDDDLPAAPLALDQRPRTGDVVLAIGNAFGLSHTVTMGIVSATGRGQVNQAVYEDFIQTDAAINSGNSGGALINHRGEVVGINSSSLSQETGAQGISFAIPADLAHHVMDEVIRFGSVRRAWIGAQFTDLPFGYGVAGHADRGVQITGIQRGGPAWRAGLRTGDILTSADGDPVVNARSLLHRIAQDEPGRNMEVEAIRNGQAFTTSMTLISQPTLQS